MSIVSRATSGLTATEFVQRWAGSTLTERAGAQPHFIDLCRMLDVPAPTDVPEHNASYGFEARTDISASGVYATVTGDDGLPYYQVRTSSTGPGFADVWKRGCFAWEYKRPRKHASLEDALLQLRVYSASLGHPPLLVVCDIDRFEIHTNFPNYPIEEYRFNITELVQPSDAWRKKHPDVSPLQALRKVFTDPEWFKPEKTRDTITAELAKKIGDVAIALRKAGNDPHAVAHFLMQVVFCFFAEDVGLLPNNLFKNLIERAHDTGKVDEFPRKARMLFKAMERGGDYGNDNIKWFNGGLFKDVDRDPLIKLELSQLGTLLLAAKSDWNAVDPSIFGTLFERSLDPDKRSQIGAHYTSREDILLIVEPVVMQPLRRTWVDVQKDVAEWLEQRREIAEIPAYSRKQVETKQRAFNKKIQDRITAFVDHLGSITVLDPACGSGNFLFVTIQQLLDLENEVRGFAARPEIAVTFTPRVQPRQVMGIEINDYACELARVSIWIGYLQWLHANSSAQKSPPILDPLDTIEHRDAILKWADKDGNPSEVWRKGAQCIGSADWPKVDFIVGNPPFLGSKLFRKWGLPDAYVEAMYDTYDLPKTSDLCCYWFELGRQGLKQGRVKRVGLLATQGIRGRENRTVLERIKEDGDIFFAISDRDWILDGAAVHVSMIGFDDGSEHSRVLDGGIVTSINSNLTSKVNLTHARRLVDHEKPVWSIGTQKGGSFEFEYRTAQRLLVPPNPNGQSSAKVIRPWRNASDITGRMRGHWIIDFGPTRSEEDAATFEAPFEYIRGLVKPTRDGNRRETYKKKWWLHQEPRAQLRPVLEARRLLLTPRVSKHRIWIQDDPSILPDCAIVVFGRADDYFFGMLQSSVHSLWALRMGTQLETRPRYTPTTCFETFPLPWPPESDPVDDACYKAIAEAARQLTDLRENWLNPPEWIADVARKVDLNEDFSDVRDEHARKLLHQSAIMAYAAKDKRLKVRTLTNLYNERPSWLKLAHRKLDEAVFSAYAAVDPDAPHKWDPEWAAAYEPFGAGEIVIVEKGKNKDSPEVIEAKKAAIVLRKEVDEKILTNLLRLNQLRAAGQTNSGASE